MPSNNAVELKGGLYTFMSLRLRTADLDAVDAALGDKVQQAPAFFKDTPVVVDLGALDETVAIDGAGLLACIRRHQLHPIVANIGDKSSPLAESVALPFIEAGAKRQEKTPEPAATSDGDEAASPSASVLARADTRTDGEANDGSDARNGDRKEERSGHASSGTRADSDTSDTGGALADDPIAALTVPREVEYVVRTPRLINRPVRSGQQFYARDTDLIIMGQVGPGAEVIADNNIHVYGPLRGRALCGVSGNADTRIFCQSLEAELVSVAGVYRMLETIPEDLRGKPAQIWLENDRLNIEPL